MTSRSGAASWVVPERFAVMAVDPGGVSGVARCIYASQESVAATLRSGVPEAWEVSGLPEVQAREIAEEFLDWMFEATVERSIPVGACWLVIEGFALRTQHADLSSVLVTGGIKALLVRSDCAPGWAGGFAVEEQSAGDAKGFASAARLKDWKMYAVGRGSDHKRDALRHLALRVARIL